MWQPFVGRRNDIRALDEFVQREQRGVLVVTAPAGYGKSALMAQLGSAPRGTQVTESSGQSLHLDQKYGHARLVSGGRASAPSSSMS